MSNTEPAGTSGSIEAVRLVKATETEWETKIAAARKAADASVAQAASQSTAAVAAARSEAETTRSRAVEAARSTAEAEAAKIVADGQSAAQADRAGRLPADRRADVLKAVLGDLADE